MPTMQNEEPFSYPQYMQTPQTQQVPYAQPYAQPGPVAQNQGTQGSAQPVTTVDSTASGQAADSASPMDVGKMYKTVQAFFDKQVKKPAFDNFQPPTMPGPKQFALPMLGMYTGGQ